MTIESNPIISENFVVGAIADSRCRHWTKIVRADQSVPMPSSVSGANDIPGSYLRDGDDVEIFPGDWILQGEANHRTKQRGWTYRLKALGRATSDDTLRIVRLAFGADSKVPIRAAGNKELLAGAGDAAAMIREIHACRRGYKPMPRIEARPAAEENESEL